MLASAPNFETMWTRRALWGLLAAGVAGSASAAGQDNGSGNGQGQQGHAPPPAPKGGSRKGDVRGLRTFAETTHPRGREAAADAAWRQHWDRVEAAADHASDGALFVALWKGLAKPLAVAGMVGAVIAGFFHYMKVGPVEDDDDAPAAGPGPGPGPVAADPGVVRTEDRA